MTTNAKTRAVRAGLVTDLQHRAVVPPIHLSANFAFHGLGNGPAHDYSRTSNPTRDLLGAAVGDLEGGAGGVMTSSGMAAVLLPLQLLSPGDLLVVPHDCYGGTYRLAKSLAQRGSFRFRAVDMQDAAALGEALAERPKMVWLETPSNPLLRVVDLASVARAARAAEAITVADNTFLSPALQRPIEHGVDMVLHSATKFINGHSDIIAGVLVCADAEAFEEVAWWANNLGVTGSPFESYLGLRGIRTLHARMAAHEANAAAVADLLKRHPAVARVHYPGLPEHPGHGIAVRQQDGFGAVLSFELAGGLPAVERFLAGLRCFILAESLGGVESLVAHPPTMTHASMDEAARSEAGITDGLLRLSVGIEHVDDLLHDLRLGLERAVAGVPEPVGRKGSGEARWTSAGRNRT